MNEIVAMVPYKVILAAYSSLPALIVLALGKGAVAVGLVTSVSLLGSFFGPALWSRFVKVTNHKYLMALGYIGMVAGLVLLINPFFIYPAVFILAFFPQIIYFVAISEVRRKKGSLGNALGRLEQAVGVAWAAGLFFGFVGLQLVSLNQFAIVLAALTTLSIPMVISVIGGKGVARTMMGGIKELKELEIWLFTHMGKMKLRPPKIHIERRVFSLYFLGIMFSLSSGTIFPQLTTLLAQKFNAVNLIYLLAFVETLSSSAFFNIAGMLRDKSYVFGYAIRIIAFTILLASVKFGSFFLFLMFYLVSGASWGFIMMFFEYSGVKLGEEIFGTFLSLRMIVFVVSSALSGILVEKFGFFESFLIGTFLFLLTGLLYVNFEGKLNRELAHPEPKETGEGF